MLIELHKDPGFLDNLKQKRRRLKTVRSEIQYSNRNKVMEIQEKFNNHYVSDIFLKYPETTPADLDKLQKRFDGREMYNELKREAKKVEDSHSLSKWLRDPNVRRQASMQIEKMNIFINKKDNEAMYQLQVKQKQYENLCDVLKGLNEQLKLDPEMLGKLVSLNQQNIEMEDKVFEETEYTNTLNLMADRYKQMMLCKQQPMQHKLKAYEYLWQENNHWKNELNRFKQSITTEIKPSEKDVESIRKQYLYPMIFEKLKKECKHREDMKLEQDINSPLNETSPHLRLKKESRRSLLDKVRYDNSLHKRAGKEMLSDIVEAVATSKENHEPVRWPYDPFNEVRIDQFFIDEEVRNEDAKNLMQKNSFFRKGTNTSVSTQNTVNPKQVASREYILMVKETIDMYKQKKQYLQDLIARRNYLEEQSKNKRSEMANKVTEKIFQRRGKFQDKEYKMLDPSGGSEYGTDVTTQDERPSSYIIPTMNDEVERISLIMKREKEETKKKLLKAKELVIAAWGLVGRICKEIRITNNDGSIATVDVIENNISDYMSLCGLKFEKLMRNNKLIKAQYERLVEINLQRNNKKGDIYNFQDEAEIYGFSRLNIRTDPEKNSEDDSDKND